MNNNNNDIFFNSKQLELESPVLLARNSPDSHNNHQQIPNNNNTTIASTTATQCLIGRQSQQISIYLNSTHLVCSGSSLTWPTLSGIVIMANDLLSSTTIVAVRLYCFMQYRAIARSVVQKLLFSQTQRLSPANVELGPRTKFPFTFDFGSQALPPSAIFDQEDFYEGNCMGIYWKLSAFLAKEVPLDYVTPIPSSNPDALTFQQIPSSPSISLIFQVAYDLAHSTNPSSPSNGSSRFSLFGGNMFHLQNGALCQARLDKNIYTCDDKIMVNLQMTNMHPSHVVSMVKITGKQHFQIRFPDMNEWNSKHNFQELTLHPNGRPSSSNDYNQIVEFDLSKFSKGSIISLQKNIYSLSPTTPAFKSIDGVWGAQFSYHIKLEVHISGVFASIPIHFRSIIKLPFVLKALPDHSNEINFTPWSQVSPSPNWTPQTEDEVAHLIGHLINDIQGTTTMLTMLDLLLDTPDSHSRQTMCTTYLDHAENLKDMVFQLHAQFRMFNISTQSGRVQFIWPQTALPVNTIVLELEMLSKCITQMSSIHPSPPSSPPPVPNPNVVTLPNLPSNESNNLVNNNDHNDIDASIIVERDEDQNYPHIYSPPYTTAHREIISESTQVIVVNEPERQHQITRSMNHDEDNHLIVEPNPRMASRSITESPPDYMDLLKDFSIKMFVKTFTEYMLEANQLLISFTQKSRVGIEEDLEKMTKVLDNRFELIVEQLEKLE